MSSPSTPSMNSALLSEPQDFQQFKAQIIHHIMVLQRTYQERRNSLAIEREKSQELANDVTAIEKQIKPMSEKTANLLKFVAKITDENSKLKKGVDDLGDETKKISEEMKKEITTFQKKIESLTNVIERNRLNGVNGASGGSALSDQATLAEVLNTLDKLIGSYEVKFAENETRFQALETTNYDGKLIWKITDFRRRQDEAKRGVVYSIYSQPFYTSRFGYKLCLRIYLNGDGVGRNTHISLFIVLMKGEYDSMLSFPFKQKVSLILMDQGPRRRHLTDAFRPDPRSNSFMKPTSDMNIASGCPLFVSQDNLSNSNYVVDDTIFIKAIIDTGDLGNF